MQQSKKILAIVPARAGSKRLKNKNKLKLAGKELIRYALESTIASRLPTTIVVSTDDQDILAIARTYDEVIPLERPKAIAGDHAKAIAYVKHTLKTLEEAYDYVAIIQPTSPLTTNFDIDNTIELLLNSDADSAVSIMKLDHLVHPIKLKTLQHQELIPYVEPENGRMAAHELPELYVRNCSVYVSTIETIEKGQIIGEKCLGYLMPRERSIDINDKVDFDFAAFLLNQKNHA